MTKDEKKAALDALKNDYRVKNAEVTEAEAGTLVLRNEQGAIVDQIVKLAGPGPHKLDGKIVKARKRGEHHQFSAMDLGAIEEL